jgi:hypothetical protein
MESVALNRGITALIGWRRRNALKTEIGLTQLGCSLKMRVLGGLLLLIDELHVLGGGRYPSSMFPVQDCLMVSALSSALYISQSRKDDIHAEHVDTIP